MRSAVVQRRSLRHASLIVVGTASALCIVLFARDALADGGVVAWTGEQQDYRVTVFLAPTPLRTGEADVSLLVQRRNTGEVVDNATILVAGQSVAHAFLQFRLPATRAAADNKLLYAAPVEFPQPGRWRLTIDCTFPDRTSVSIPLELQVHPPLAPWTALWPWYSWPLVVIVLFVISRRSSRLSA